MSKKVIVLADNSYTIRRIVELSFSEIENIEVRSFENGSTIKEKLLQLTPAVVIVDIKLPELNGYDVCRFVNETPALGRTRVFLMKGSFEPVDNDMIKNLKYEDIITKPFDSNALVGAVMKIVNQETPRPRRLRRRRPRLLPRGFPRDRDRGPGKRGHQFFRYPRRNGNAAGRRTPPSRRAGIGAGRDPALGRDHARHPAPQGQPDAPGDGGGLEKSFR